MAKKFDPDQKHVLVSPERYEDLDVSLIMALIPVLPFQTVADIGCGPGFFTTSLGKQVYAGQLFAIDIQQQMLDAAEQEVVRVRLNNVSLILSHEDSLPLEDSSLDGAFVAFVLHENDDPGFLLQDIWRCLHRGSWLAVLEWRNLETNGGPPLEERISEADLITMAQKIPFRLERRHSLNDRQYMLVMWK